MIPQKEKQDVPLIDIGRCTGCGRCVAACPLRLITLETHKYHKYAVITRPERCTLCAYCIIACPIEAIRITDQ